MCGAFGKGELIDFAVQLVVGDITVLALHIGCTFRSFGKVKVLADAIGKGIFFEILIGFRSVPRHCAIGHGGTAGVGVVLYVGDFILIVTGHSGVGGIGDLGLGANCGGIKIERESLAACIACLGKSEAAAAQAAAGDLAVQLIQEFVGTGRDTGFLGGLGQSVLQGIDLRGFFGLFVFAVGSGLTLGSHAHFDRDGKLFPQHIGLIYAQLGLLTVGDIVNLTVIAQLEIFRVEFCHDFVIGQLPGGFLVDGDDIFLSGITVFFFVVITAVFGVKVLLREHFAQFIGSDRLLVLAVLFIGYDDIGQFEIVVDGLGIFVVLLLAGHGEKGSGRGGDLAAVHGDIGGAGDGLAIFTDLVAFTQFRNRFCLCVQGN